MTHPTKILIVEDEMIIGAKLSMYLTEFGYEVTGMIPRAEEALLHLQSAPPDLVLLDIQLRGEMDGIALAELLYSEYHIPVIFLTANADDATFTRAKATHPYAFLNKPLKKRELKRTLELTVSLLETEINSKQNVKPASVSPSVLSDRIFVYYQENKIKIMLDDILYIQAERNYCHVVTKEKDYLLTMPMKSLEAELPVVLFQRIHRSYIVNLTHVNEVGDMVVKVGEKYLTMSKSYRQEFLLRIKSV